MGNANRHQRSGLADIHDVAEVVAARQEHFHEQEILRGDVARDSGSRSSSRSILLMARRLFATVKTLATFGCFFEPFGEGIELGQIGRVGNAALALRVDREKDQMEGAEPILEKVRVATKGKTIVEILDDVVVDRYSRDADRREQQEGRQRPRAELAGSGW